MSISPWLTFLGGLIIGGAIGLFFGRKNYESCREQLQKLTADLQAGKAELSAIEAEIGQLQQTVQETEIVRTTEEAVEESVPAEELPAVVSPAEASEEESSPEVITTVSRCPQKLARIRGIGRVYEDKLFHAGIGSFWQVATASNEQLAEIFGIRDFQAVDLDAIKADARRLAEETDTVGHVWNGQKPDDFESLPGIGKTYETRLYDAGICTFEKLASMTEEELAAIVKAPKWNQPDYTAWITYAKDQVQKQ